MSVLYFFLCKMQGDVLKSFADICTSMACNTGESKDMFIFATAYRGTSCGDQKVRFLVSHRFLKIK